MISRAGPTIGNVIGQWALIFLFTAVMQADEKSPSIAATDFSAEIVFDQQEFPLGEPAWFSFILHNHSDRNVYVLTGGDYRNGLGRPDSFKIRVTDSAGQAVSQPGPLSNMGGLEGLDLVPARGSYQFRLFMPHWAILTSSEEYHLTVQRKMQLSFLKDHGPVNAKSATILDMRAESKFHVTSPDAERLGKVIEALGIRMLDRQSGSDEAKKSLSAINDPRVIPVFIEALRTRDYSLKFTALRALQKFGDDHAFEALKEGMATTGADFGETSRPDLHQGLAKNIKVCAAYGLACSPHSEALPFLLACRHDEFNSVRLIVAQSLGPLEDEEAIPILKEMMQDSDEMVRRESERILRERLKEKGVGSSE